MDLGEELRQWQGLIVDESHIFHRSAVSSIYPHLQECCEEMSLLNAYSSPSDAILLSVPPIPSPKCRPGHPSLLSVELNDWEAYYSWRGLPLTSPLAFLFHWPLTLYFILQNLLPAVGKSDPVLVHNYFCLVALVTYINK